MLSEGNEDLPEGDLSNVTFRLKSQILNFNNAYSSNTDQE